MPEFILTEEQKLAFQTALERASIGASNEKKTALGYIQDIIADGKVADAEQVAFGNAISQIPEVQGLSLNGWVNDPKSLEEQEKLKKANLNPQDPMQGLMMMLFSIIAQVMGVDTGALGLNEALNLQPQSAEKFAAQNTAAARKNNDVPAVTDPAIPPAVKAITNAAPTPGKTVTDEERAIEYYTGKENEKRLDNQNILEGPVSEYRNRDRFGNDIPIVDYSNIDYDRAKEERRAKQYDEPNFSVSGIDKKLEKTKETLQKNAEAEAKAEIDGFYSKGKIPPAEKYGELEIHSRLSINRSALWENGTDLNNKLRDKTNKLQEIADYKSAQELAQKSFDQPGQYGRSNLAGWLSFGMVESATDAGIKDRAALVISKNAEAEQKAREELRVIMAQEAKLIEERLALQKEHAKIAELSKHSTEIDQKHAALDAQKENEEAKRKQAAEAKERVEIAKGLETAEPAKAQENTPNIATSGSHAAETSTANKKQLLQQQLEAKKRELEVAQEEKNQLVGERSRLKNAEKEEHYKGTRRYREDAEHHRYRNFSDHTPEARAKLKDFERNNPLPEAWGKIRGIEAEIEAIKGELSLLERKESKRPENIMDRVITEAEKEAAKSKKNPEKLDEIQGKIDAAEKVRQNIESIKAMEKTLAQKQAEVKMLETQIGALEKTKGELGKIADTINGLKVPSIALKGNDDEKAIVELNNKIVALQNEANQKGAPAVSEQLGKITDEIKAALKDNELDGEELFNIRKALSSSGVSKKEDIEKLVKNGESGLKDKKTSLQQEIESIAKNMTKLKDTTDQAVQNYAGGKNKDTSRTH